MLSSSKKATDSLFVCMHPCTLCGANIVLFTFSLAAKQARMHGTVLATDQHMSLRSSKIILYHKQLYAVGEHTATQRTAEDSYGKCCREVSSSHVKIESKPKIFLIPCVSIVFQVHNMSSSLLEFLSYISDSRSKRCAHQFVKQTLRLIRCPSHV